MTEMETATEHVTSILEEFWTILLTPASLLFIVVFLALCVLINRLGWNDETRWDNFRFRKPARPLDAKDVKNLTHLGLSQENIKHVEETGHVPLE